MSIYDHPYLVTAPGGRTHFFVGSFVPRTMAIAATGATRKTVIRLAGGMNNGPEIFDFFRTALADIDGAVLMSGGTRAFNDDGATLNSVCEVVADLSLVHPNLITMGSFPRTGRFGLVGDGRFMVGDGVGATINVGTQYVVAIQDGPEDHDKLGWDGDLSAYFSFMEDLQHEAGFLPTVIIWNGGGVTVKEAEEAHKRGFPVIIITGTGRAADNQLSAVNFSGENIYHIDKTDPESLRALLWALRLTQ